MRGAWLLGSLLLVAACAGKDDTGTFGGGGSNLGGGGDDGGAIEDDSGETGVVVPVIVGVSAGFKTYTQWVIEFVVGFDYPESVDGGTIRVSVTEEGADRQSFSLEVGSNDAPLVDGDIQFAFENVSRTLDYDYTLQLVAPDGTESEVWEGRVDAVAR